MDKLEAMEAKRRGRPRRGGPSAWGAYIRDATEKGNVAMALLGARADRLGYSMRAFAEVLGVDEAALRNYFAYRSRAETIEKVARALGFDRFVARILTDDLSERDVHLLERRALNAFPEAGYELIARGGLDDAQGLAHVPEALKRDAYRAFAIAERGLDIKERSPRKAFADTLAQGGHSFFWELLMDRRPWPFSERVKEQLTLLSQSDSTLTGEQLYLIGQSLEYQSDSPNEADEPEVMNTWPKPSQSKEN